MNLIISFFCGFNFKQRFKSGSIFLLLIPGLMTMMASSAQETEEEKGIRLRRGDGGSASSLQVRFEPVKSVFEVGEPLRFEIRGNKRFFLYLYTTDPDTGQTVLILPNQRQTTNQYEANRTYRVPNPNIEFYADEPGRERFTMLATTRYLEIDSARFNKSGDFLSGNADDLEQEFESKGIRIRGPERNRRGSDRVVKDVTINVEGYSGSRQDRGIIGDDSGTTGDAKVFLSTEKEHYAVGEQVRIVFGADREGWLHLYTTEPDGYRSLLTRKKVDGNELQHASARAQAPGGQHALIAVYTEDSSFDDSLLDDMSEDKLASKGLSLVSDGDSLPSAVQRFWIEE